MGYTCGEIVRAFRSNIKPSYERAEVNYAGKTADTGEYYTEVIASLFLDGEQLRLPEGEVRDSFAFDGHDGSSERNKSARNEEKFCLARFNRRAEEIFEFGRIVNYQVNILKRLKINVDLVAYDENTATLTLVEVKGSDVEGANRSKETLLRCVLEIETYFRLLAPHRERLFATLAAADKIPWAKDAKRLQKAVWVKSDSRAAQEWREIGERPALGKLIEALGTRIETY